VSVKSVEEVIGAEAHLSYCILYSRTAPKLLISSILCVDKFHVYF
jgi:hypothetical protein